MSQNSVQYKVKRRAVVLTLRAVVSAALLMVLIVRVPRDDWAAIWPESISVPWLVAALAFTCLAFVMATIRWWEVVHTLGLSCDFPKMLVDNLAGQFVSNFLPTTVGGDVLRVNRLGRITGDHYRTFASVIIERLTGWLVLPLLTLIAVAVDPGLLTDTSGWVSLVLLLSSLGILLTLGVLLWLAEHPRGLGRITGGTVIRDALGAIHVGLALYRRRPRAVLRLLTAGFAYQVLLVVSIAMAAAALGVRPGVAAMFAFVPIVLAAQVLPISVGGLGVREAVLIFLLSARDVAEAEAVLLGLLMYLLTLVVSLVGAPALAFGGRSKQA